MLGERARKRLDAEPLGRVVPGGDEMDPELPRSLEARLLRLARQEEIEAIVRGLDQVVARAAARDRDSLHALRPVREDERLPAGDAANPVDELVDRERLREPAREPDRPELSLALDTELAGE